MNLLGRGLAVIGILACAAVADAQQQPAEEPPTTEERSGVAPPAPPPPVEPPPPAEPPPTAPEPPAAQTADSLAAPAEPGFWEGGGIRVTEGTILHPGVTVGTSYQTNVFFQDTSDLPNGPVAAPVLRAGITATWGTVSPARMELESPGTEVHQRIAFNLDLSLDWFQYLSSNPDVRDVSDLAVGFLGNVAFNPGGTLELDLRDGYIRNVTPGQQIRENADRDRNEAAATLHYRPGGGALDTYLQYAFIVDVFEAKIIDYNDRLTHTGTVGVKWQWLPRTQLMLEASLGSVQPSNTELKPTSVPFRVWAGISTLFTPVFGVIARGGYGAGNYASGEDVKTYLALAELRYALGPAIHTALGWSHDFADSLIGNFYLDHAFYASAGMQLGARWQIRARGEVRLRDYGNIMDQLGFQFCGDASCAKTRRDVLPRVDVNLDYQITPWLIAEAAYSLQADSTDFFIRASNGTIDRGSYVWNEFLFKLAARW